jgi:oxygen-independent coproporphyrinogen-3 oxidase
MQTASSHSQGVRFDADLIQRYDVSGPRYTSYPTSVQFHEGFDSAHYRKHIAISNDELIPAPLSLYVHLPFCHSLCYYCGCNKKVTRNPSQGRDYLKRLAKEIARKAALFDPDREVIQLHFGGGTPTFFDDDQLAQLVRWLRDSYPLDYSAQREFSIEIDPRTVNPQRLQCLAELGFNRISLGVQDTDPEVQQAVNRVQDAHTTLHLLEVAREQGFNSVSIDLIYGLPRQTLRSFAQTLELITRARPDRLAIYNYAHMPHIFRSQRMIKETELPSAETRLELMELTIRHLTAAGYVYIGMDHFALPEDELSRAQRDGHLHRNFQGYSTRCECDLIGLGVSAISKISDCFAQNHKELNSWSAAVDAGALPIWRGLSLNPEDLLRQSLIDSIMCQGRVDFTDYEHRYHIDFTDYFPTEMSRLAQQAADGLIELDEDGLQVTSSGRLLLRHVAMVFDQYLQPQTLQLKRFSRVI